MRNLCNFTLSRCHNVSSLRWATCTFYYVLTPTAPTLDWHRAEKFSTYRNRSYRSWREGDFCRLSHVPQVCQYHVADIYKRSVGYSCGYYRLFVFWFLVILIRRFLRIYYFICLVKIFREFYRISVAHLFFQFFFVRRVQKKELKKK